MRRQLYLTMFDIHALLIKLTATNNSVIGGTQGHLCHSAFLNMVRQFDPNLSEMLHRHAKHKTFTISEPQGFVGKKRSSRERFEIRAGDRGYIRVTLLDTVLFQTFINHFVTSLGRRPTIRLGSAVFSVDGLINNDHRLVGRDSFRDLEKYWNNTRIKDHHRTITFRFSSPTCYRSYYNNKDRRTYDIFPNPTFVFGGLAKRWDKLTGRNTSLNVRKYAEKYIDVTQHRIHTQRFQMKKSNLVGFVGHAQFELRGEKNDMMIRHINRLADLAFFTGSGTKTTQGMGQVQRVDWMPDYNVG